MQQLESCLQTTQVYELAGFNMGVRGTGGYHVGDTHSEVCIVCRCLFGPPGFETLPMVVAQNT